MTTTTDERARVLDWLREEEDYQRGKWSPATHDELVATEGTGRDSAFFRDVTQYMHRAHVLGNGTPLGKQALLKALSTLINGCDAVVRVFGDPPPGGSPSGEVRERDDG